MAIISYLDEGYIILSGIELPGLPDSISVDGYELQRKDEFHVTLVGGVASKSLPDSENSKATVKAAFDEFAKTHDLTQYELTDELRLLKRDDRVTVVVMVKLPGIDELYEYLNAKLGTSLPVQPTHITIYSLDPNVGISLNSLEQLNETTVVDIPEVSDVMSIL
jgi:hypothetical protein